MAKSMYTPYDVFGDLVIHGQKKRLSYKQL